MLPQDTTHEEWRPVVGYEGIYSVSSLGRVRRERDSNGTQAGRLLTLRIDVYGYHVVGLWRERHRTWLKVHRLVAAAFIGPCPDGQGVNHRDGIKANNSPSNLEYLTPGDNSRHGRRIGLLAFGERAGRAKLTEANVREARVLAADGWGTTALGRRYGVTDTAIRSLLVGKSWRHVT